MVAPRHPPLRIGQQKRKAPQYLLYYNSVSSTTVIDSRHDSEKYYVYEGTDKIYKFVLRNVEESDSVGLGKLEQPEISVSRARDESAQISCKASINSFKSVAIHWYRQKPKQGLEFLLYVIATPTQILLDEKYKKMEASKNSSASTSTLTIYSLEEDDEAIYYCSYG
ncbi:T-cell receptor gamma chain [Sigmodon hispidus]